MSVSRRVNVVYDIDTLEKAAKSVGFRTARNANVRGYAGRSMESCADLVISSNDVYDIGFKVVDDGVQMVTDFHGGSAERKLEKILPAYFQAKTKGHGFKVQKQDNTKDTIHLTIGRG